MKPALLASTLLLTFFINTNSYSLPIYAQQVDKSCLFCHISKFGGGKLNPVGKEFQKAHLLQEGSTDAVQSESYEKTFLLDIIENKLSIIFILISAAATIFFLKKQKRANNKLKR